jgi:putative Holliday junction resolvase
MSAYFLAFDYGTRRIGVAVGQTVTATASPLRGLDVRNSKPDWDAIGKLIREWQPAGLVVGLPLHKDGAASAMTEAAQGFGRQLQNRYRLPVYWINEHLSSHAAAERGANADDRDAVAAQIILETWLAEGRDKL